ncbi:TIGR03943 family putative permease subunit [Mesobacillus harenae]|uniref:TIGR03943 family putative permease subunit n=1 Tax=Mesobacillus harenae TaxID=2213203 RepID=UPI0015802204|nr:TIGR03943 family protein [Mesobacillus harenae]
MQFHIQQAFRAVILLSFSVLIYKLHFTGEITKFINPKYELLSQTAALMFLILFFIQITRVWTLKQADSQHDHSDCHHDHGHCDHHHDHGTSKFSARKFVSYLIVVFPLFTGFFLPASVLDASMAEKKGGMLLLSNRESAGKENKDEDILIEQEDDLAGEFPIEDTNEAIEPEVISNSDYENMMAELENAPVIEMNDTVFSTYYDAISMDIDKYQGRKIKLKGFVYKEEGFDQDQLVISRFLITHCVADASIGGFLSQFKEAADLSVDTWIEAEGTFSVTTYNEQQFPLIKVENWKEIEEPSEPYVYPISVKIE